MQVVELPAKGRGYWLVTAGGVLVAALGGVMLAKATSLDVQVPGYFALGGGVFMAFFGALLGLHHRPPARLELDARRLRLVERCGDAVDLPWAALEAVDVVESQQSGSRHTITLRKRDGGIIELDGYRKREQAMALAQPVVHALDDADRQTTSDPPAAIAGVDLARRDDRLVLTWNGAASPLRLVALGPIAGMGIAIFGFHLADPSLGTIGAMAFVALLGALTVGSWSWTLGTRQRITIDRENLTVERLRGDRVVHRKAVPVFTVVTVDYSDRLNVHGEALTIRTGAQREAVDGVHADLEEIAAEAEKVGPEHEPNALAMGMAIMKLVTSGITVPLGRLSRAACIALDLAVSAEVARRAGKTPGSV